MKKTTVVILLSLMLVCSALNAGIAAPSLPTPAASSAKDTITLAVSMDANGLCPITSGYSNTVLIVVRNIYECLVTRDSAGNIIPVLATGYEWAEDNMSLTFTIRQGVAFSNGDTLTANDVVWTFKDFYLTTSYGASEDTFDFANIEKLDDYTVRIPLLKPSGDALARLCDQTYSVMNRRAVEEAGEFYSTKPIGTGPYTLVSYTVGDEIVMKANEAYWSGVPAIKNMVVRIIPEATQAMIELENGNVDVYLDANYENIKNVLNGNVPGVTALNYSEGYIVNLWLNYRKDWTRNKALRECLNYAINKNDIVIAAYEDLALPANQSMGRVYVGAYVDQYDTDPLYTYNPELARQKLADAGFAPGELNLELNVDQNATMNVIAQLIKKNLEDIGINLTINTYDSQAWVGTILGGAGDVHLNISCVGNGYPINYLVCSNPKRTPNWDDVGSYDVWSQVFDRYNKALAESDPAQIFMYVQDGVRIMSEEALTVPLVEQQSYVLMSDSLKGVVYHGIRVFSYLGAYFE